ncbi:MAG: hypothetical protein WKG01_14425 [Kofleriaceae bacterium]
MRLALVLVVAGCATDAPLADEDYDRVALSLGSSLGGEQALLADVAAIARGGSLVREGTSYRVICHTDGAEVACGPHATTARARVSTADRLELPAFAIATERGAELELSLAPARIDGTLTSRYASTTDATSFTLDYTAQLAGVTLDAPGGRVDYAIELDDRPIAGTLELADLATLALDARHYTIELATGRVSGP